MPKSIIRISSIFFFVNISIASFAQKEINNVIDRPKLVVGIMVDQMRWDFLYRYYNRYSAKGFKRLLNEGFTCENTLIPYAQSVTACGHTCVYTGSVPAINGIIGNNWYSRESKKSIYCAEDSVAKTVGSSSTAGEMSPKNLEVTTITDELRLATNFKSKSIGIALKDRGAILPVGKSGNAAYWYDGSSGQWITSTYYMAALPDWVQKFNGLKMPDKYYGENWNTLYPTASYTQSTTDDKYYEGKLSGYEKPVFPHKLSGNINNNYNEISSTPFGNTLTAEMAKAAIENEKMGQRDVTDFLAVSFSSTDYVGHRFGPNSIETEDTYLRLDIDLATFFGYLDKTIGKGQYLLFLTADHGVMHSPGFSAENKLPGGLVSDIRKPLNSALEIKFGIKNAVLSEANYQIYLNYKLIEQSGKTLTEIKKFIIDYLKEIPGIANAFDLEQTSNQSLPQKIKDLVINGYHPKRSGDIQIILNSGYMFGEGKGLAATHGLVYPYDGHIPLVWMGWNIKKGKSNAPTFMTDIAPTIAAMLRVQMPSGNIGKVIEFKK